jgi:uncharacterized membrane protein
MEPEERDTKLNALLAELDQLSQSVESQQRQLDRLRQEIRQLQTPPTAPPSVLPSPAVRQSSGFGQPENPLPAPLPPAASVWPREPAPAARQSLEQYIGGNLINKVGILILVLGVGIFLNYAFENNLLNPVARISLGYVAGVALVGLAYWLKKNYPAYGAVLLSGGVSTLYFTTYIAYDFYGLLPHLLAFGLMVVVTVFTIYAASVLDQQVIGVYGLVGAYAVPLLLSQNSGQVAVLFTYMAIINAGVAVLAYRKRWPAMNVTAFVVTWLTYGSWFFLSYAAETHLRIAMGFGALFSAIFYVVFAFDLRKKALVSRGDGVLLVGNAFIFYLLGYAALNSAPYEKWQGLFTLAVAAVHGGVAAYARGRGKSPALFHLALVLAVAFLTISVPVQMDGVSVTYVWAAQAVVLIVVGERLRSGFYGHMALAATILTVFSLFSDWSEYYAYSTPISFLLNRYWGVSVWVVLSQLVIVWMARRESAEGMAAPESLASFWRHGLPVLAVALLYGAFAQEVNHYFEYRVTLLKPANPSVSAQILFNDTASYLQMVKGLWLLAFSGLYVAALVVGVQYFAVSLFQQTVLIILSAGVLLWWLVHGLPASEALRDAYLQRAADASFSYLLVRYMAYAGVGLCVAVAARLVQKLSNLRPGSLWKWYPVAVHVFVIALLGAELVQFFVWLGTDALYARKALAQKVGFSVLWGVYALALVGRGIWRKRKVLRVLGIALFAVTLVKLFLFDLGKISTLSKIIAFVGLGVLLLVISFLYQKFKDVIMAEDEE